VILLQEVPIWEKSNLTIEEASAYFGIGVKKIRELTNGDSCPFVLWVGNKRLIKRLKFEEYLSNCFSV
jgi:excisionase family DNA binding protein